MMAEDHATTNEFDDLAEGLKDPGKRKKADPNGTNSGAQQANQFLAWPQLSEKKAPARRFILPDWIPAQSVTLLHGFGGVGKTLLAQQIGTAAAFAHEILGGIADACPVLAWFGEDDHDEIWRRQEDINAALGIESLNDLDGKLFWRPCPGHDITLFTGSNERDYATTPEFENLRAQIKSTTALLTILDSASQIAAIPENNRPLVTRCLQALTGLCLETGTTILLIGHNNRDGDYSGSSAWENRVRSRLHMKRDAEEDGTKTLKLARPKANYAADEAGVTLEWHRGAYRCTDQRFETYGDRLDRELREGQIDQIFLNALDRLTEQHRALSHAKTAGNYAPRVMAETGFVNGTTKPQLEQAMRRLFDAERIIADAVLPWSKTNRHPAQGLARKGAVP